MNNNQRRDGINKNTKILQFPNVGVLSAVFSDEELAPLKEEILEIQNNFSQGEKHNSHLAGNIRKEFVLTKSKDHVNKLLEPFLLQYEESFGHIGSVSVSNNDQLLGLDRMWVNFQEKHEFNPVHNHTGVISFVIWIDIPYNISDEKTQSPGAESNRPIAGHFTFYYTNSLGKICQQHIPADSSMNNYFLLFPAELNHSVSPFYTSDKHRISVSGNYSFQVPAGK